MLEPRRFRDWADKRPSMRFLGGTNDFDLWHNLEQAAQLRVVKVAEHTFLGSGSGSGSVADWSLWDTFMLPLDRNTEIGIGLPPTERRLVGCWDDIRLTREQVNEIEAYLQCFAPWVLGEGLTDER